LNVTDLDTRSNPPPVLVMRGIRKRFGATIALDGVDLSVDAGEVLALVGENGAGKSTLMKVLSGAHPADDGEMILNGMLFRPRSPIESRAAGVTMIYQEISLAPHLSIAENILLGVEPMRGPFVDRARLRVLAQTAMERVGRPGISVDQLVSRLSIAEQQLVEIARALVIGSKVIVFDEPTSSLTSSDIEQLFGIIRQLIESGAAVIYISHFLEEVKAISSRYTVLRDGRSVATGITASAAESEIIAAMVGRAVDDLYPRSVRTAGETVLDVTDLGGSGRLASAGIELRRGEVVGIAGLVGSGRTEFIRAVFGLDSVKRGAVKIAHIPSPLARSRPDQRWECGIGMVSENRKEEGLALGLAIADNIAMTKMPVFVNPAAMNRSASVLADRVSLRRRTVSQSVGELSGGNQQKVAIARLLYHDADVLLLDEPTRGIDVGSKAEIYRLIDNLAASGKAVLMVSSYLPELLGVCDRIAVMCRGVLGPAQDVAELDEHSIMLQATRPRLSQASPGP
jgi:ribose transport system ATP-binding protein